MSGENYRSASKSHEPGWNDPPKVAYGGLPPIGTAAGSAGTPPKTALNKRVAFPLGQNRASLGATPQISDGCSTSPPAGAPMTPGMPPCIVQPHAGPPPAAPAPGAPPCAAGGPVEPKHDGTAASTDRDAMLQHVRSALDGSIERMEEGRREEIQKRINLIYDSWADGKLPEGLEKHLHSLASALLEKDGARASAVHRSVICDFGSKCALWAPALRQLIFALPPRTDEPTETNVIAKPI